MSRTLEDRRGRLRGKVVSPEGAPVWNPEARVTMGNDMLAETRHNVMELLSEPLGPKCEASRQVIEQENKECWSRACGLSDRSDIRPKVNAKQKRSITAGSIQANPPNAVQEQLGVAIPVEFLFKDWIGNQTLSVSVIFRRKSQCLYQVPARRIEKCQNGKQMQGSLWQKERKRTCARKMLKLTRNV